MKKLLTIGSLLAVIVLAVAAVNAPYGTTVVSSQSWTNQTSSVTATTLYTATEDGDYLVSCYAALGTTGGFDGDAAVHFLFTDDFRLNTASNVCDANSGAHFSSGVRRIHVVGSTDIQVQIVYGTIGGNTPYNAYVTVEKL